MQQCRATPHLGHCLKSNPSASSVEQLAQGQLDPLLSRCKRVREKNIALATGGYCQARQNLPKVLMERSVDEILQRLCNRLGEAIVQQHAIWKAR